MNYTATNVGPYGLRSPYSMFNGLGQLGPGLYNVRAGARFFNDINATSQAFVASGMETVELNNSSGGIADLTAAVELRRLLELLDTATGPSTTRRETTFVFVRLPAPAPKSLGFSTRVIR